MAEYGYFFDAVQKDGEWDRTYNASDFAQLFDSAFTTGVIPNKGNGLKVLSGVSSSGLVPAVIIETGSALIEGYMYLNTSPVQLDLEPLSNTTAVRIDRVVLTLNRTARRFYAEVLTGTPSASPSAPQLTRTDDVYQLALADVTVSPGSVEASEVADKRSYPDLCGWCGVRLKDADLRGLTENWYRKLKAVFDDEEDDTTVTDVLLSIQNQLDSRLSTTLLYAPSSVAALDGKTILQNDSYKGYDAIRVYLRFHDGSTFYYTKAQAVWRFNISTNKWDHTDPVTAVATVHWGDRESSVLVPSGTWQCCTVFGKKGEPAIRWIHYDSSSGEITISPASVGGNYNASVPYEWYENNTEFYKKAFSSNGRTTSKPKNAYLNHKAECRHFAIPTRIYGVRGFAA